MKNKFFYQAAVDEVFDPANDMHRRTYWDFVLNNGWGNNCPFALEPRYKSIPDMCKEKLLDWYLASDLKLR